MATTRLNGTTLHFEQTGRGRDVVLIHGLASNLAFWMFSALPYLRLSFRVTLYDLRGHGASDMPDAHYRAEDMAEDLLALLDALNISRAHLVGHSFGGLVALHLAARWPERVTRLVVADTRVPALQPPMRLDKWSGWPEWQRRLARAGLVLDGHHAIDFHLLRTLAAEARPRPATPATGCFVPFVMTGTERRAASQWLRLLRTTTALADLSAVDSLTVPVLLKIGQPTLAIFGQRSPFLSSCEALGRVLPACRTRVVRAAGHFLPIVKPRAFAGPVRHFLRAPDPTLVGGDLRSDGFGSA